MAVSRISRCRRLCLHRHTALLWFPTKISSKTRVHDIPKADMLCVGLAVCHECKMLRVTFRYLSFHGYHHRLIRHEVMHMPCGLWQHDEPDDISPRMCAAQRTTMRNKKTHTSARKHLIAFFPAKCPKPPGVARMYLHPFHRPIWSEIKCLSICKSVIDFFPPFFCPPFVFSACLNPLFALHSRWLRFLFPPLSMHEVNGTGEPRDP